MTPADLENSVKRFLLETDLYARLTFKTLLRMFSRPAGPSGHSGI
jgi:hypothetical protein